MMTHTDSAPGNLGATRARYGEFNFNVLVAQVAKANPRAGKAELYWLVAEEISLQPEAHSYAFEYTATNYVNSWWDLRPASAARKAVDTRPVATPPAPSLPRALPSAPADMISAPAPRAAPRAPISKEEIAARVEAAKQKMILLGMLAPNGKPLAQCTIDECKAFGGWYLKLAIGRKGTSIVGDCYTEQQLREAQTWTDS